MNKIVLCLIFLTAMGSLWMLKLRSDVLEDGHRYDLDPDCQDKCVNLRSECVSNCWVKVDYKPD